MKKSIIILSVFLFVAITNGATLFWQNTQDAYPTDCVVGVDLFLETRGQDTLGAEVVLGYLPQDIDIIGIQDGGLYDFPAGMYQKDGMLYYATTNLGDHVFDKGGKLMTLVFKAHKDTKHTNLSIFFSPHATNDTNVVGSSLQDVLMYASGLVLSFDDTLDCPRYHYTLFESDDISHLSPQDQVSYLEQKITQAYTKKSSKYSISYGYGALLLMILFMLWYLWKWKKKRSRS